MREVAKRRDALGVEYTVWFVEGDLWYMRNDHGVEERFGPVAPDTPVVVSAEILDYCARELLPGEEHSWADLEACARANGVLASEEGIIASVEDWPEPTPAALACAWEYGF